MDWQRALVLMAHPDDPEYGAAPAVATWVAAGHEVRYVLGTRGEAGIAGLPPAESGPLREEEQRRACDQVGVRVLEFLDHPDGRIEATLALRRDLATAIRRHRPDLVVTLGNHERWAPGIRNSADHRAFGTCVLDAVADAANEWIFPELAEAGHAPWAGVRWIAVCSPTPTHSAEVTPEGYRAAVRSLAEHRRYLAALSDDPVEEQARRVVDMVCPEREGRRAAAFEVYAG
ncbi:PIG-L deacetylase family protein [Nakamurella endophytica]